MTPWSQIDDIFFDKMEKDPQLFQYYGLTSDEAKELATQRAHSCLKEAAVCMALNTNSGVNFTDFDDEEECFNADLNYTEQYLLACLAVEMYVGRDVARLAAFRANFVPTDLQVFSPANDRKTFMEMYADLQNQNRALLDAYNAKDRDTLERLMLTFTDVEDSTD